jgi:hypothetical protein
MGVGRCYAKRGFKLAMLDLYGWYRIGGAYPFELTPSTPGPLKPFSVPVDLARDAVEIFPVAPVEAMIYGAKAGAMGVYTLLKHTLDWDYWREYFSHLGRFHILHNYQNHDILDSAVATGLTNALIGVGIVAGVSYLAERKNKRLLAPRSQSLEAKITEVEPTI